MTEKRSGPTPDIQDGIQVESSSVREPQGEAIVAAISREVVGIHARYYGRGPTKAKTVWREELILCLLEEIFTRAEEVLVASGHFEQVRANRQAFQDTVEPLFRQAVENATGRRVRSFLSQISAEGVASEVFLLERDSAQRQPEE